MTLIRWIAKLKTNKPKRKKIQTNDISMITAFASSKRLFLDISETKLPIKLALSNTGPLYEYGQALIQIYPNSLSM